MYAFFILNRIDATYSKSRHNKDKVAAFRVIIKFLLYFKCHRHKKLKKKLKYIIGNEDTSYYISRFVIDQSCSSSGAVHVKSV